MIDKIIGSLEAAVADIKDGATVLCAGFGAVGAPDELIDALQAQGARDLVIVANNAGNGRTGLAGLIASGHVRKVICSYPRSTDSTAFDDAYKAGKIELELVPHGTISERMRSAAAGLRAFYSPVALATHPAHATRAPH